MTQKRFVYLDYNATTPLNPEVLKAMEPFLMDKYGNALSIHQKGQEANAALEEARTVIGDYLGTESVDIIFTSGGTESNNLAIKGVCLKNKDKGNHIITSSFEHLAVHQVFQFMADQGFDVTYLPVDRNGLVDPSDVEKAIRDQTILVSVMHANNEVGTIQPIKEIAKVIKDTNLIRSKERAQRIYFHTDAVQSFGKIPVRVEELGIDLLSISSHKIYGPKGIGLLYIRKGTDLEIIMHGGHQERGIRAGTHNIPGIVGFAEAVKLLKRDFRESEKIEVLRDKLHKGLSEKIDRTHLNGHATERLPNTINIGFEGLESESLLLNLDMAGIAVSTGSACTSSTVESSRILEAMGIEEDIRKGSIRISLGLPTTDSDIDYCIKKIPEIIEHLRSV